MNSILQVKLNFSNEKNPSNINGKDLRSNAEVTTETNDNLIVSLRAVFRYYRNIPKLVDGILIDVKYNDIIAKSSRIQEILRPAGKRPNDVVVGARFSDAPEGQENHIITYYVDEETINRTINDLEVARRFLNQELSGKATSDNFKAKGSKLRYDKYSPLSKTRLRGLIIEC